MKTNSQWRTKKQSLIAIETKMKILSTILFVSLHVKFADALRNIKMLKWKTQILLSLLAALAAGLSADGSENSLKVKLCDSEYFNQ